MSLCGKFFLRTLLAALFAVPVASADDKLTADELLQHHLDSIGNAAARAAAKSRVIEGNASYRVLVGGSGQIDGTLALVSEGNKALMRLKVSTQGYTGEWFTRDGDKTNVAGTYQDKSRSEFGTFLRGEDIPLRDGLLGGVLTTGWSLLDLDGHKGKLKYQGLKKVEGTDLYVVTYQPKKNTDLEITLFFEPGSFHHVRTVYMASQHAGIGKPGQTDIMAVPAEIARAQSPSSGDVNSARQQQTRYRIEERFSDFKTVDGLTLPSRYDLRFQEELQSGFTKLVEWDISTTRVMNNVSVDARNFQIH